VIEEQMAKADREGRVSYLEISNVVNLGFYGRLGFETVQHVELSRGYRMVKLDCMTREPRPAKEIGKYATGEARVGVSGEDAKSGAMEQAVNAKSEKRPQIEIKVVKDVKRPGKTLDFGEKMGPVADVEEVLRVFA